MVSLGIEKIFPIQYNGYEVGSISISMDVGDEDPQEMFDAALEMLRGFRKAQAAAALEDWARDYADAADSMKD